MSFSVFFEHHLGESYVNVKNGETCAKPFKGCGRFFMKKRRNMAKITQKFSTIGSCFNLPRKCRILYHHFLKRLVAMKDVHVFGDTPHKNP